MVNQTIAILRGNGTRKSRNEKTKRRGFNEANDCGRRKIETIEGTLSSNQRILQQRIDCIV